MGKYTVIAGQNIFDVALHIYGSIEGVIDLMMNNTSLSLAGNLKAGDKLEFTDGFVIDPGIVAYYRMNGIVPANGERRVYCKSPALKKVFKIRLNNVQTSAGFIVSGSGEMEIDWGDNSTLEAVRLSDRLQTLSHWFDNSIPGHRNITVYGDFSIKQLDFTDLQAFAISLFRPLAVEKFILKNGKPDVGFISLFQDVYDINLSGLKTASLLPLLECKKLMRLYLPETNIQQEILDNYLIALVKQYYGRRNCMVTLTGYPSGEYREPAKDKNGNYILTGGMEAVWLLCNEPSWNEAGYWKFIIGNDIYTTEP